MKRQLYDLAAADPDLRFSPYCWRSRLALAHKNLPVETIPWRFTDKDLIAFSGQGQVPVLVDGETVVHDSNTIATYLETTYPNEASLFGDAMSRALTGFVTAWVEASLFPAIRAIVLPDIFKIIDPKDQAYFRASREPTLGMSIEALGAAREDYLPAFYAAIKPLTRILQTQSFIAGVAPAYADHVVFAAMQWAVKTSVTALLAEDDVITLWMRAVLDVYGIG